MKWWFLVMKGGELIATASTKAAAQKIADQVGGTVHRSRY